VHFQEMIVESLVAGHIWFGTLRALLEESQSGQRALCGICSLDPAIIDRNWQATQAQTRGRNAAWRIRPRIVSYKSVLGIRVIQKIAIR
jgi:hypothetical protein